MAKRATAACPGGNARSARRGGFFPLTPALPMNRTRKLLEMNECSKTGSWAQGAIKVRGDLSLRERVRVRGKNLVEYAKCSISQGFFSKWSPSLRAIVGLGGRGSWPLHFYCVAGLKVAGIKDDDIAGLDPVDHFDPVCAAPPNAHRLFNRFVLLNHENLFDAGKRDQSIGRHAQGPLIVARDDLGADE